MMKLEAKQEKNFTVEEFIKILRMYDKKLSIQFEYENGEDVEGLTFFEEGYSLIVRCSENKNESNKFQRFINKK